MTEGLIPRPPEVSWHLFGAPEGQAAARGSVQALTGSAITLALDQEVRSGARLWVKLDGPHPRFAQPLLARVTQADAQPGGGWLVGCALVRPLSEEEVRAAQPAGPPAPGGVPERRAWSREGGLNVPVVISVSTAAGREEALEGCVQDRSLGGLRLLLPRPFVRGTVLRVHATSAARDVPLTEVEVRYCRAGEEGGWVVGVQFREPPSRDVVARFR